MPLEVLMKSISSLYKDYLRKDLIIFDEKQLEIVSKIKDIIPKNFGLKERIISLFYQRRSISKGIYLWGKAGSGKTMIMDMCFSISNIKGKQRIHFQEFMIDIHNRLHEIRKNTNIKDPLNIVAKEISNEVDFLCFDEFQVNDIADASILYKLFNLMLENGTFIFVTSNIIPKDLYKDGLQRDRFIPFIKLIENNFLNLELSTKKDYRRDKLQNVNTYFSKLSHETNEEVEKLFDKLSNGSSIERRELLVKGRKINVDKHAMGCASFDFDELCNNPLGSEDYLAIAREFEIVFIRNIPKLSSDKRNQTKRLILLIDALYDNHKMTIVSADGEPEEIYSGKELEIEFKRCVSRLHEMRSEDYVDSSRID
jgi:cell division protein ZapE